MRYWDSEEPVVADTGKNILRYFPQAGRLQVSLPNWTNDSGQQRHGRTITIDLNALCKCPDAVNITKRILVLGDYG